MKKAIDKMIGADKVARCSASANSMEKPNTISTPTGVVASSPDTAGAGRAKLRAWAKNSGVKNVSFWIPPHVEGDKETVIAKMAAALNRYEEKRAAGEITYHEKIKFVRKKA